MRRCLSAAALAAALSGCATTSAPTRIERVEVPVAVACFERLPARPDLLAERAWQIDPPDEYLRIRSLIVDRIRLATHIERLEAVLLGCIKGVDAK